MGSPFLDGYQSVSVCASLVAGPGVAPDLEDYAFVFHPKKYFWDSIFMEYRTISSPHLLVGAWRVVSTDLP